MLEGMTPPKPRSVYCKIQQMSADLSEKDYEIFIEAVNDTQKWPAKTLTNSLRSRGVSVADTTITKHRTGNCACFRD